jgi:hypothetical protein
MESPCRCHAVHHLLPVEQGELLRPPQVADVGPELGLTLNQVRQVRVGQADPPLTALLLRDLDVPRRELVADAAASGVQEQPDAVMLVEADLDEVDPAAENPSWSRQLGAIR